MGQQYQKWSLWKIATIFLGLIVVIESLIILHNAFRSNTGSFGLPNYSFTDGGNYISAYGSWISDSRNGLFASIPVNTTNIECDQLRGICVEARAITDKKIVDNRILTQSLEYQIKSWTPQEITAVYEGRAGTFEIRIDKMKRVVTMIETEKAGIEGARALPAHAHLGDGQEAIKVANKR